ncbi:hypothetical protein [Trinickia dinghuensis]|uniref:Preprotein translocase subunit SecA n=1 Tax=Trinickia dinghuensis TaxID=2291023 RepID=A0A3D8JPS1_9BURK|nr:hypothetical protein [Trinickia dinghuensis]RDU94705.1 hypothetical protein DWV00_32380 [Trinickia dinghuensis]
MLSPHELSTLMLVRSAPDQIDMTRVELDTLMDCRLISLESPVGERRRPVLTSAGAHLLDAAARLAEIGFDDEVDFHTF